MAITIHGLLGNEDNETTLKDVASFINDLFGGGFNVKNVEEEGSVYLYNPKLSIGEIDAWNEMEEYAGEKEIYIHVYDHDKKEIKSYYYDEDEVWIDNDEMGGDDYEANMPK
jgi:hypothetical protein